MNHPPRMLAPAGLDGECLHHGLGWLGLDLHLLAEHHPLPGLRGLLLAGLDHHKSWESELACLLQLLCADVGQGIQHGHHVALLQARALSQLFGNLALRSCAGRLHRLHGLHRLAHREVRTRDTHARTHAHTTHVDTRTRHEHARRNPGDRLSGRLHLQSTSRPSLPSWGPWLRICCTEKSGGRHKARSQKQLSAFLTPSNHYGTGIPELSHILP